MVVIERKQETPGAELDRFKPSNATCWAQNRIERPHKPALVPFLSATPPPPNLLIMGWSSQNPRFVSGEHGCFREHSNKTTCFSMSSQWNLRKGLKQSFGMDKTGPNPPTRRDHLIPPVPRAKRLPSAGTSTNQKGVPRCNKKEPSGSAAQRKASKQTSSKQHQASEASKRAEAKQRAISQLNTRPTSTKARTTAYQLRALLLGDDGQ